MLVIAGNNGLADQIDNGDNFHHDASVDLHWPQPIVVM
jgi:hypothetical protein